MTDSIDTFIQDLYDAHVRHAGVAVRVSDAKEAISLEVAQRLEQVERDYLSEAELRIDKVLEVSRRRRRLGLKKNLETLLVDAAAEDGTYVDPLLDMAYSLGDPSGVDKALRFWTAADFRDLVVTAYRSAAEVTAAATELDQVVSQVEARMRSVSAAVFGDAVSSRRAAA